MSYSDQSDDDQEPTYEIIFEDDVNNSEDIKQSGRKGDRYLRRDGRATAKFANDDIYVGEYRDGKRNGQGIYTFANRAVYSGKYVDNRKHGFGTFTAPDGGIYEGDWVEDKREGHGTYKYPNGDVYKGGWKAGAKHGTGTYTYAAQGCSVTGDWSNGQLMHGTWSMHDGSKYVGEFSGNQPQGAGLYVFASGHTESGRYLDGKWVQDEFVQPPPNAVPPKPVPIDPFRESCRAMDKAVLKVDHFEAIYRLKKEIEGVPNYRKIADYHVYGCGQPTLDGFRLMLEAIAENGCDKVVWINMRNEPVIYVNTWSYAPRSQHDLNENMELLGLTVQQLGELETRIMQKTKKDCQSRGGLHHYYKDTFAENPADRKNLQLIDNVSDLEHIRTVQQIYDVLSEDDYDVTYHRLPIVDERSPSHADFDNLVEIIKNADPAAAIVFNCQMGKGRTTTGTVIACLIRRVLDEEGKGDEAEPQEFEEPDPSQQKSHGQYTIIMNLVKALPRGEVIKQEVDDVIDRCRAMQNLRDCIHYTKEMYMSESESRRGFWKRMSYNFVERYFMLILFHAYLKQAVEDDFATSFSKWVAAHPQYMELLGNRVEGPLSTFEWN